MGNNIERQPRGVIDIPHNTNFLAKVFFADIGGDGKDDLLYVTRYADSIRYYRNEWRAGVRRWLELDLA